MSLSEITLPDNITTLPVGLFGGCSQLKVINLPNTITEIAINSNSGIGTFEGCSSLSEISLSNITNTEIPANLFKECTQLKTAILPQNINSIGANAFMDCESLTNFPDFKILTLIGRKAFSGCKLLSEITFSESFNIKNGWGDSIFSDCTGLVHVTFLETSNSTTQIPKHMFAGCTALQSVKIPNTQKWIINSKAFYGCTNLSEITLPNISRIGDYAFAECSKLKSVYIKSENPPGLVAGRPDDLGNRPYPFPYSPELTIYIPEGTYETYYQKSGYNNYKLVEFDYSGIADIPYNDRNEGNKYFSIDGRPLAEPCNGINIVQTPDGKTRKIWIKK